MRVYVAGAGGAVGKPLVRALVKAGHDVTAMTRSEAKSSALESLGARVAIVDALNAEAVSRSVSQARPEVVIHELTAIAPSPDMRNFDRSFEATNRLRTVGTDNLLQASVDAGVKRFVAQSFGAWIYEKSGSGLKTESDPLDPRPPRDARETLEAIRYLEDAVLGEPGIQGVVLRYGFFYGPGTSIASDGATVRELKKRRIPLVGTGAGVWSFCHVEDAGLAAALAAERGRPGIYNIADDEPAPVSEWLPELARILGARAPMRIPSWFARLAVGSNAISVMTRIRGMSSEKAKKELGWKPVWPSWREGFRQGL